jgi:hypothetical protein
MKSIVFESEEYLTIGETAIRLKLSPKTVKNKMASGIFKKRIHYFSPPGMGPRFKWSAIIVWLEQVAVEPYEAVTDSIPMARGYSLGELPNNQQISGLTLLLP